MGASQGGKSLNPVRGPSDEELRKGKILADRGFGRSIKEVFSEILGYEVEPIIAYAAERAIQNAIAQEIPIDMSALVSKYKLWQARFA